MLAYAYPKMVPPPTMPPGLVELMEDLTKEVLRNNPTDVYDFCAHHMQKLLEIREGRPKKKPLTLEQRIARAQNNIRKKIEQNCWKLLEIADQQEDLLESEPLSENKGPVHHEQSLQKGGELEIFPKSGNDEKILLDNDKMDDDELNDKNICSKDENETKVIGNDNFENVERIDNGIASSEKPEHSKENINSKDIEISENKDNKIQETPVVELDSVSKNNDIVNADVNAEKGNNEKNHAKKVETIGEPINAYFTETAITPDFKDSDIDMNVNKQILADNDLSVSDKRKLENESVVKLNSIETTTKKRGVEDTFDEEEIDVNRRSENNQEIKVESYSAQNVKEVKSINTVDCTASDEIVGTETKAELWPSAMKTNDLLDTETFVEDGKNNYDAVNSNPIKSHENMLELKENLQKPDDPKMNVIVENSFAEDNKTKTSETESNENNSKENDDATKSNDNLMVMGNKTANNTIENSEDDKDITTLSQNNEVIGENDNTVDINDKQESKVTYKDYILTSEARVDKQGDGMTLRPIDVKIEDRVNNAPEKVQIEGNRENAELQGEVTKVVKVETLIKNDKTSADEKYTYDSGIMETIRNKNDDELKVYDVAKEDRSDLESTVSDISSTQATMDLETAAITTQKVFRNFLFKSRASTFDESASDESNTTYKEYKDEDFSTLHQPVKDRRPPGLGRMDTMLQTVNEEKSLSLSTDDSSTISSAATIIQAHVRGFLARNKWNTSKTISFSSPQNSNPIETQENNSKTILNIHIVPENGHFISRDDSVLASMDLSLDGSPPTSTNLHPLSFDVSERRKLLKREDAIQSISPPSNNSGKLSEDAESVKELPLNEIDNTNDSNKADLAATQYYNSNASINDSLDNTLHNDTTSEIKYPFRQNMSNDPAVDTSLTKKSSDEGNDSVEHKNDDLNNTNEVNVLNKDTVKIKLNNKFSETVPLVNVTSGTVIGVGIDKPNVIVRSKDMYNQVAAENIKDDQNLVDEVTAGESLKNENMYQGSNETGDLSQHTIYNKTNNESTETTPTNSLTSDTVKEVRSDNPKRNDKVESYHANDPSDVMTPIKDNERENQNQSVQPKLLHSGEFHDIVLPTKVSRNETSVIRGE